MVIHNLLPQHPYTYFDWAVSIEINADKCPGWKEFVLFINHIIIIIHGNASMGSEDIRGMSINDLAIHLG